MTPTQLFVYGTLRHDQPEHARFCRGVTGWQPARLRGDLWMLAAGYRIITVAPAAVLLAASIDPVADEQARARLGPGDLEAASRASAGSGWIEGELLEFQDVAAAWPPIDGWEEFSPARPGAGCYARAVVPVDIAPGSLVAAWAYVATQRPPGAEPCSA